MSMGDAPNEALATWIDRIPLGRALDLGAGDGRTSLWLAERGFRVDAVEQDSERINALRRAAHGMSIFLHPINIMQFRPVKDAYALVVAEAILHFLAPSDLRPLAKRLTECLAQGGVLIAEVFTTDDPGYDVLRQEKVRQIEPNTFEAPSLLGLLHYFESGELRELFPGLRPLEYVEDRRLDPTSVEGYRGAARLVAQRELAPDSLGLTARPG